MKNLLFRSISLISLIFLFACGEKSIKSEKIATEDFFRNPDTYSYKLSPDGRYISFLKSWKNRLNVYVKTTLGDDTVRVSSSENRDVKAFFWVNSEQIAFYVDTKGKDEFDLYLTDISGSNEKIIYESKNAAFKVLNRLPKDENNILISENSRDSKMFDVYKLNINTGEKNIVLKNPGNYTDFIVDHDGKVRIAVATDGVREAILYRKSCEDEFHPLMINNFKDYFTPRVFTSDNKNIYALSNLGRDKTVLVEYDLEANEEVRVVYEHPFVDVEGIAYSTKRNDVVGVHYTTWKTEIVYFDEEIDFFFKDLKRKFPGYNSEIVSIDKEENYLIIRNYNDKTRGKYYLYDLNRSKFSLLANSSPWLKEDDMANMKPVSYLSYDNTTINGYLVLPKDRKPVNLPVVVMVHGGPSLRVKWQFDPVAQFLANRGYAVFMMNFRGSTGYGKEFWTAGFQQWGLKIQEDISSGVDWMIEQNIADPDRIAVLGNSFGGYSAMMELIINPDLYSCGISIAGLTDLIYFLESVPPYWEPFRKMLSEMIGDPLKDKERLKETSPIYNVNAIKTPLFLAYGKNDSKVNLLDVKKIHTFLKEKKVPSELIIKKNEGHHIRNQENKIEIYNSIEKFLDRHIGSVH